MTRDLGRSGNRVGRHAGRWAGGLGACLLLLIATSSEAVDEFTPVVKSYSECVQAYRARRTDFASYCRTRFPLTVRQVATQASPRLAAVTPAQPAETPPSATPPASTTASSTAPTRVPQAPPSSTSTPPPATTTPPSRSPREPVDITPAVNKLIETSANRPRPPKPPPPRPPADPLAVIPQIQAACAAYAGNAERWRRCTTDAWNKAGLRGQPPLVLQAPPAPPPVDRPPAVVEPTDQTPVRPPPSKPEPPPALIQPDPPVDVAPPPSPPEPKPPASKIIDPPLPPAPIPTSSSIPLWAWVLAAVAALVAAGAGGFGLSRWLSKARPPPPRPPQAAALTPPKIVLVADLGMVVLTPDGPPRAGMAVSMRFVLGAEFDADTVRLDYPSLETAP